MARQAGPNLERLQEKTQRKRYKDKTTRRITFVARFIEPKESTLERFNGENFPRVDEQT